jgi:cephalosporin-C deacetylase
MFDMTLTELETYRGTNPRPQDLDTYWEQALTDLDNVDPQPIWKKADMHVSFARCDHLWFTGIGGARIHAKVVRPAQTMDTQPAILHFHGYGGDSGNWLDKLPYAAAGFTLAAMDCRGQRGRSTDPGGVQGNTRMGHIIRGLADSPERLYYRQVFLDTVQLARVVMALPEVDENRMGATGWSQGGGLTLACAALVPTLKRIAPVYPFLSDYKRVWDIDLASDAYAELAAFFRDTDPLHQQENHYFTTLGYIDVQHLCPRIRAEVYMGIGLMDKICPPSTQFAAYNAIQSPKRLEMYPDFGHEDLPGHQDRIFSFLSKL